MFSPRSSRLLAAPGARSLIATSLLARLPLAMFSIAILVHTRQLTRSFAVAGLATSAYAICGAISGPALGRLVDRTRQTRVLVGGSALGAAVLISAGLLPAGTAPWLLVALAAVAGLATPPLDACVRTLLPGLVSEPSQLPQLFALESTALELTFVFGPPLALGLGAFWSTGGALIVSGSLMVAGTVSFALQPPSRTWRPDAVLGDPRRRSSALRSPPIRALIAVDLGMGIVFGATEVGVTATAQHLASAAAAAPVLGLWGLGSLIGGIVATRAGGGARSLRGLGFLVTALALTHGALMLGTESLLATGAIILLAGATIAPTASSVYAMADRSAPAGTRTEAFSWLATSSATGAALGAAVAGGLAQDGGPVMVFAFAGVAGLLAAMVPLARARACEPRAPRHAPRSRSATVSMPRRIACSLRLPNPMINSGGR